MNLTYTTAAVQYNDDMPVYFSEIVKSIFDEFRYKLGANLQEALRPLGSS